MRNYDSYKESDVFWFPTIPSSWDTFRFADEVFLKHGFQFRDYDFTDKGIKIVKISQLDPDGKLDLGNCSFIDPERLDLFSSIRINEGDILMALTGGTIGKIIRVKKVDEPLLQNYRVGNFFPSRKLDKNYLFYQLASQLTELQIDYLLNRNGQPNIGKQNFKAMFFCLPPLPEQHAIAQYLDIKTQAIDKRVKLLEQKIKYSKELRKSIINNSVTKGLDKTVALKDSGIEWIGDIPEHWEVERFKDSFELKTGNSISDKGAFETKENANFYVSTKDIDIDSGAIKYDNGLYVPINDKSFKRAKKNSTLICIEGANAGKKMGFTDRETCFVNKLCSIKGKKKSVNDKYSYYFMNSKAFGNQFSSLINGLIGGVSINQIKFFNVLLPPTKEQIEIANYLDQKTAIIDQIVQNIAAQIERLKELRKTLINDVVTGKIKVVE